MWVCEPNNLLLCSSIQISEGGYIDRFRTSELVNFARPYADSEDVKSSLVTISFTPSRIPMMISNSAIMECAELICQMVPSGQEIWTNWHKLWTGHWLLRTNIILQFFFFVGELQFQRLKLNLSSAGDHVHRSWVEIMQRSAYLSILKTESTKLKVWPDRSSIYTHVVASNMQCKLQACKLCKWRRSNS